MNISRNNKIGSTLIIAISTIMALSILAMSVLSLSGSQAYLGQAQINKIKAEQLARGAFWVNYISLLTSGASFTIPVTTLEGTDFTTTLTTTTGTGPGGTTDSVVTVVTF